MIDLDGLDPALHEGLIGLATSMRANGYQRHDPVREIPALLGDRWTTLILLALDIGPFRHAELLRAITRLSAGAEGKISQRILTAKLRVLERDGFVVRTATTDVPPRVSYALTDTGAGLVAQIRTLQTWVFANRAAIEAARAAFDARDD